MHMATPTVTATDPDFDLDISIVESGPAIADLMRSTDNGCGQTCQSACTSCKS
jgi:FxLD family lantipeptide